MNKNLLHKTDKFFLNSLKDHVEEPSEHVWEAIEKRLSQKEKNKPAVAHLAVLSIATLLMLCLSVPFLLVDSTSAWHYSEKETGKQKTVADNKIYNHTLNQFAIPAERPIYPVSVTQGSDQHVQAINYPLDKDLSLAAITPINNLNKHITVDVMQPNNFQEIHFPNNDNSSNDKITAGKSTSTIVRLSGKHTFSIMPFFSVDHISGRFIEQYEFDNLTMNDYSKREKPDMSYTAGVLGAYRLNKRFSLLSGISFSSSMLSITSTAVNAMRDAEGKYKFKLATSYGLAEISKSGMQPTAGDSLLVSGATMQFNYISFPVLMNYDITDKRLKLAVHGGIALNNVISEKMEVNYKVQNDEEAETIDKIEGIRTVFFTLNTGLEAKYSLNHTTDISISPELRYGINAINKGTPIKTYPINYGLSFNFYFKF
jgi:hypothetical protein